ncbi:MAG TPA: hypothetical protein VFF82_09560 [Rhodocyclaceae bacterium]|nr:hypothetical protein [Rhodocyclaceae bacterium]
MARSDPAELAMLRLEARRFVSRCEVQAALIQRADTLRELSRLAMVALPYRVAEDYACRDAQRRVALTAEDRAKQLIQEQIQHYLRAEAEQHDKLKGQLAEDWGNLTGSLSHLRTWAQGKLLVAEQAR